MCDYSLHALKSRPAAVGDKLETHLFANHGTTGIADPAATTVAVCLLPGTEVSFATTPVLCKSSPGSVHVAVARFRQVDTETTYTHHDALEFADGTVIKINDLTCGQQLTVLQLPAPKLKAKGKALMVVEQV